MLIMIVVLAFGSLLNKHATTEIIKMNGRSCLKRVEMP
jgi:hypothetical protein